MKRAVKLGLWSLLGLILALLLAVTLLLASQSGSRWLLDQVPGLQVDNFSGRLAGQWRADALRLEQATSVVSIQAPAFRWSPACLLRLTLCIERLAAERIDVTLTSVTEPSDTPFTLPDIRLPLALELGEVSIGALHIDGTEQLQTLQLNARWAKDGLQIDRLLLERDDLSLALQGHLQPNADWPLQLTGEATLPAPAGQPWQLQLKLSGALQQSVQLTVDSSGYLQGRLVAELQPLLENLPARAQLTADAFKASADLPDTLRLDQLQLNLQGDLAEGYAVDGSAVLPGEGGAVALALEGVVDAEGARIGSLNLTASPEQQVTLSAVLDWRTGLSADGRIEWQAFPWRRLYPTAEEPPVELRQLTAELAYADSNYLGNFAAQLEGPAGAFSLNSPLSGDLTQVHLPDLQLRAGQGRADGRLTLGFADGIRWDTDLQLSELDPAYWLAELPGTLAGALRSQGTLKNQQLALSAALDLKGRLRGHPASFQLQTAGADQQWTLENLDLRLGDNRVSGSGALTEALSGRLNIGLDRLGQLWPGLQGQLSGALDLAGSLQAPQGQLALSGASLGLAENRISALQLDASLNAAQQGQIELNADGIELGETRLGQLTLSGQGTEIQQQLTVALDGPLLQSTLAANGTLNNGIWRGRVSKGRVQSGGQDWRLQQAATLSRSASGTVELGAHCWRSGAASLCAETQRLLPEPQLAYRLSDFPLGSLAQWLPRDLAWQGSLDAELQLDLPASGPSGRVLVDAGQGSWRIREQDRWVDFAYDTLSLSSQLTPQRVDTRLTLRGPEIGELTLQAQLDPRPVQKPLVGEFRLSGLNIAIARPFVPMVERLTGQLNGSGSLGGTLLAPQIDGSVRLSDAEIAGAELPTQFENLQLQARINGQSLRLDGNWRAGEAGQGSLTGDLAWSGPLTGQVRLQGSRLPVNVEPFAELEAAPDLRLEIAEQRLAITGELRIPRGAIVIRELPPSTVQVSEDARIVGQTSEPGQAVAINMDVDVIVGEELLTFSGFGLNADLAGRVHVGNDLDTRGELNLNNGRFRAYGQRLTIRRARLLFAGPIDQPFLDVEAIRRVDDVVVGLRLTGNAEQPRTEVFSEPAMSQEQALSYLVLGRPLGEGGDGNLLAQAALAIGMAGSVPITQNVASRLGISDFQLDTEGSGASTSVVASGNLSERLSLRYGVGVFEPANTVALRYELTKRLYLEAASGLASSLDLFYRRDF
ncbi:translocation/assembly module TamB domain-containing protein [Pseudomonas borbori]